jgi:hypothetical protein
MMMLMIIIIIANVGILTLLIKLETFPHLPSMESQALEQGASQL